METSFETRRGILTKICFLCCLLSVVMTGDGTDSDIFCLKSIKESLEDPFGYLSSWNFNNKTEGFICRFTGVACWHPDENRVLFLMLSNMGLKGQFPRGIGNCSSLTRLDLSINQLSGPIPPDISTLLPFATNIDLSSNEFSGEIPVDFANCAYLNTLKLDHNTLRGQIPQALGLFSRIKTISFTNNHLSGPVPPEFQGFPADIFANNKGLCGEPLPPCPTQFYQSFKDGLIVGYAFSVTSAIVIYMSYCSPWTQLKLKKNNRQSKAKQKAKCICFFTRRKTRIDANHIDELLPLQLVEKGSKQVSMLLERFASRMRFQELSDATDCFSIDNAIGVGKMGIMYKGRLPNGWYLAVKKVSESHLFKRQFLLETMIMGKCRHRNIVPLLGFCVERKKRILVYQYLSNGRLSKWLHPLESEDMRLKWPERIKIALGIARGLTWLHHRCNLHIAHLNICSECILLDRNFEPKISNFGDAKFMNHSIEDGDLDMRFYVNDGKKDVYDFGSVLFEMITGKTFKELSSSSYISNLAGGPSNYYDAIDKSLIEEGFENEVYALIKVACECVQPFPDQRPTMLEVYNNMCHIWEGLTRSSDDSDTLWGSKSFSAASID